MSEANHAWPFVPLGKLAAEMCLGKMLDKQKNRGTLQPYLRNVNVRWFSFDLDDLKEMRFEPTEESRFGLKSGDLVVCEGGEPGRAAVWNGQTTDARIQKALHRVRFRPDEYDPSFAMYYLYFATITNRLAEHYTGTTIKHLTGKALARVEFPVPSIAEQRRIVAKIEELFSDLDAGVAALRRVQANLKRYRAAVLKAAVEGKLTAAWRAENPCTEPASDLLKRILAARRQKWEQQQLAKHAQKGQQPPKNWRMRYEEPPSPTGGMVAEVPQRWCRATVGQINELIRYGSSAKAASDDGGIPVLRMGNIQDGKLDFAELKYLPVNHDEFPALYLANGDLLFNRTNSAELVGKAAVYEGIPDPCSFASYLIAVRVLPGCHSRYLCYFLNSPYGRDWIASVLSQQVGQANVNGTKLQALGFPLPPNEEQCQIIAEVEQRLSVLDQAQTLISTNLDRVFRLRQAVLTKAFAGKLLLHD